jgi:hypothetical protein
VIRINRKYIFIFIGLLITSAIHSQPSYTGGIGDGSASFLLENSQVYYGGGQNDGHSSSQFNNINSFYQGGQADGADNSMLGNKTEFYKGGSNDGFSVDLVPFYFIWDGSTGTGWNIADNWNTNAVPTKERRVIIPAGVPTFPFLNAGTLKVGDFSGSGTYEAKEIIIEPGALMVGRINSFIENYGVLCIHGTLELRNTALNTLINKPGASILIKSGGILRTNY